MDQHPSQLTLTREHLHAALRHWEDDARSGRTRSRDETASLPLEQVAEEASQHLWALLPEHGAAVADLPDLGAPFEGGLYAGVTTRGDGVVCAVALLPDKPADDVTWEAAMDWAKGLGAELPTRPVAALLFANVRGEFEPAWHWTCESNEVDGSYAWFQYFGHGYQYYYRKRYEGRARAVRVIPLVP